MSLSCDPEELVRQHRFVVSRLRAPTADVARDLLGAAILRRFDGAWIGGIIVETEAYLHRDDAASHAARGLTGSNASMFAKAGTSYVYPIHSRHCFNVVTGDLNRGEAVLVRAIQPVWGLAVMARHRGIDITKDEHDNGDPVSNQNAQAVTGVPRELTNGPGKLCQALMLDRTFDGRDLQRDPDIALVQSGPWRRKSFGRIAVTTRIGLSKAVEKPLRFFVDGNRFVSGRAGDHSKPRRDVLSV